MAVTYTLEAQSRTIIGKHVKKLRAQNLIPAVVYGAGFAPIHISVPRRPLEIVLSKAGGTHLIMVTVDGHEINTLVREVQRNAIRREILHVDFLHVDMNKKLRTEVNLLLINTPKLGTDTQLAQNISSIEVECLPANLPDHIEVDISRMTVAGRQITVGELPKLEGVDYLADAADVIIRVTGLSDGTAAEAEEEALTTEPEVIEKGKKEEEDF